jgi:hypothetical protein
MARSGPRFELPVDAHEKALNDEIARLEREIASLNSSTSNTKLRETVLPANASQPVKTDAVLRDPAGAHLVSPPNSTGANGLIAVSNDMAAVTPLPLPPTAPLAPRALPLISDSAATTPLAAPRVSEELGDPRFNELGMRKFDVLAWWRGLVAKVRQHTMGPTSNNPHMIRYLATGSVQGLRPLRYERRVARNRLLALVTTLVVVLYGLAWVFLRNNPR